MLVWLIFKFFPELTSAALVLQNWNPLPCSSRAFCISSRRLPNNVGKTEPNAPPASKGFFLPLPFLLWENALSSGLNPASPLINPTPDWCYSVRVVPSVWMDFLFRPSLSVWATRVHFFKIHLQCHLLWKAFPDYSKKRNHSSSGPIALSLGQYLWVELLRDLFLHLPPPVCSFKGRGHVFIHLRSWALVEKSCFDPALLVRMVITLSKQSLLFMDWFIHRLGIL